MIYVMSDIHGNEARYKDILKQIKLSKDDTLYVLGDVIDRGEGGIRILRHIMRTPNIKMLLGNHELLMLDAIYYPVEIEEDWQREQVEYRRMRNWYGNGGHITHNSIKRMKKEMRKETFKFLDTLPINIEVQVNDNCYILVHAGITENFFENTYRYDDVRQYSVWARDAATAKVPEGKIMIFGHTPTWEFQENEVIQIWKQDDRIGIDCGCAYSDIGRLCCLRLDDMKEFYSEV